MIHDFSGIAASIRRRTKRFSCPRIRWLGRSIAAVLWDDLDPSGLSADQQQSLLDWLHWGGTLVVSGPDTLDLLRGSFLDPYLPASGGAARPLTAEILAPLAEFSATDDRKHAVQPIHPVRPWSGLTLVRNPAADFVPQTGELVVERRIGRGRVVATAFRLSQRELQDWPGCDTFWNACILRHPPRKAFLPVPDSKSGQADESGLKEWPRGSPQFVSGLRYVARDLTGDGTYGGEPAKLVVETTHTVPTPADDTLQIDADTGQVIGDASSTGVGGWNDFSAVSDTARHALRSAAGITIPRADFVVWMVAAYLCILGPLNWGFFKLLGRAEWAWAATPVLAIVAAVVVTRAAHLNIGFARAQKEIGVLEMQQDYPRAHLSRYTAVYTSLSTRYEVQMDDAQSLLGPLAVDRQTDQRRGAVPLTLDRNTNLRLTGFDISSNSTAFLHSEQMLDVGGGLFYTVENGRPTLYNRTRLKLHRALVLRRTDDANTKAASSADGMVAATLDEIPPGKIGTPLDFKPWKQEPTAKTISEDVSNNDPQAGQISLAALRKLLTMPGGFSVGDVRLIAELNEPLEGMQVLPEASQPPQVRTIVVAHLRHAELATPARDIDWTPAADAMIDDSSAEPADTSDGQTPPGLDTTSPRLMPSNPTVTPPGSGAVPPSPAPNPTPPAKPTPEDDPFR